jgi:cupin 2 domain-containing protein
MNLFANLPAELDNELVTILAQNKSVRIERIVSTGHCSPARFWYDQDEHEWVMLLKGEAQLQFEDEDTPFTMKPGSSINIASHRRHRVEWTTPDEPTVWLAVFYRD